jgi:tRNA(Ile2) C34 agmatinyltransferase TiaS
MEFLAWLLTSPWALAALVVAVGAYVYIHRIMQRCPHCRRLVRRAVRGWFRCPHCGRQYHRSVPQQR